MNNLGKILMKLGNQTLGKEDLEDFLEVLKFLSNQSVFVEDELYGWDKAVQVNLKDSNDFYIKTDNPFGKHPKLVIEFGKAESPDTTIITDGDTLTGVICGRISIFGGLRPEIYKVEGNRGQAFIILVILMILEQEFSDKQKK